MKCRTPFDFEAYPKPHPAPAHQNENKVLFFIENNPGAGRSKIMNGTGIYSSSVDFALKKLTQKNLIRVQTALQPTNTSNGVTMKNVRIYEAF